MLTKIVAGTVILSFALSGCAGTFDPAKRMGRQNLGINYHTMSSDIAALKRMGRPVPDLNY